MLYDETYFERQHRFAQSEKYQAEVLTISEVLNLTRDGLVLDIGCGTGLAAKYISERVGCRVVAYDLPIHGLKRAEGGWKVQGDAHSLPFKDASFDGVYILHAIGHVVYPDVVLKEAKRVLRPGGRLGIVTPNRYFVYVMRPLNWLKIVRFVPDPTVLRFYTPGTLRKDLQAAGFHVIANYTYGKAANLVRPFQRYSWARIFRERIISCGMKP